MILDPVRPQLPLALHRQVVPAVELVAAPEAALVDVLEQRRVEEDPAGRQVLDRQLRQRGAAVAEGAVHHHGVGRLQGGGGATGMAALEQRSSS